MTISEHTLKTSADEPVRRFEVFTGAGRRRDWSDDDKVGDHALIDEFGLHEVAGEFDALATETLQPNS